MFDLSTIKISRKDELRAIRFPTELSLELAEFIGIMIGDGHLTHRRYKQSSSQRYRMVSDVKIACNKNETQYIEYIQKLFFGLFNVQLSADVDKRSDTVILRICSQGIVLFLHKFCEIPLNKKTENVFMPLLIQGADEKRKCAFLRGLADTDFSINFTSRAEARHYYPVIAGCFRSKILVQDLEKLYQELGFKYSVMYDEKKYDKRFDCYWIRNTIYLNGKENFRKWISLVSSSSLKFQRKIEKWQKDGICAPGY